MCLVPAQTSSTNCNDTGRAVDTPAGSKTTQEVNCPSITLSVSIPGFGTGVSLSTPSSCPSGTTNYSSAVYRCEGAVAGSHCTAAGYKVPFQVYSFAPDAAKACPSPASVTFDTFEAAVAAFGCQPPPQINSSFDWSAKVTRCGTLPPFDPLDAAGSEVETAEGSALVWDGDPEAFATAFVMGPLEAALAAVPRTPVAGLPGPVAQHWSVVPPLPTVSAIVADLEIIERIGMEYRTRNLMIEGAVAADRRFDITLSYVATGPDGVDAPVAERYGYDGSSLRHVLPGADRNNFFAASHSGYPSRLKTILQPFLAVGQWVKDPLAYDRLPALGTFVGIEVATGQVTVTQDWSPVLNTGGQVIHWFDAENGGLASRTEYRGMTGSLLRSRDYLEYAEVSTNALRPMTVVDQWWDHTGALVRQQTTRIRRATPSTTTPGSDFGRIESPGSRWFILRG